jgi:hypothetical protein
MRDRGQGTVVDPATEDAWWRLSATHGNRCHGLFFDSDDWRRVTAVSRSQGPTRQRRHPAGALRRVAAGGLGVGTSASMAMDRNRCKGGILVPPSASD